MTSHSVRTAALEAVRKISQNDTLPRDLLEQVAEQYKVSPRSLSRWYHEGLPTMRECTAWAPTLDDYSTIAKHLSIMHAWQERFNDGLVPVSYRSYLRALGNGDRGLLQSALHGHAALVRHQTFLVQPTLHRNYEWGFDHTKADIWVTVPGYRTPVRPWLTLVGDNHCRPLLTAQLIHGHPTAETVAACLVEAAVGEHYDNVWIGGLPVSVVFDNAKEHLSRAVEGGLIRLGSLGRPTHTYASWENGKSEKRVDLVQREVFAELPGYTGGGVTREGDLRFVPELDKGCRPPRACCPSPNCSRSSTTIGTAGTPTGLKRSCRAVLR